MTPALAIAPGTPFQQMSETARRGVEGIIKSLLKEDTAARRSEVRKAWQQRLFKLGQQHLDYDTKSYVWTEPDAEDDSLPAYMDTYNIYAAHERSFVSMLGQNWPGGNAVPHDLQVAADVTAASYAEKMRLKVDRMVHMKSLQLEAASNFCTDGRTILWARVEADTLKITLHGVLESKVPVWSRDIGQWPFLILARERDVYGAKDQYTDFKDKISGTADAGGEAQYERYARLNILSGRRSTDGALKNLTTEYNAWIRPSRYRKASDAVRNEIAALFPQGLRAVMVSGVLVDCVPETMESAIACEWPVPGKDAGKSMLHDLVPIQGSYNDVQNMQREQAEYAISSTWVNKDVVDEDALSGQRSVPGAMHLFSGSQLKGDSAPFVQETATELSPQVVGMGSQLLSMGEFIVSDPPSLYGGGQDEAGDVYATNKLLSDKAKGLLYPAWRAMQWLWAKTYTLAIPLAASVYDGPIAIQGGVGQESFDPQQILDGRFTWHPDEDSAFPETTADKRAAFQMVMTQLVQAGDTDTANSPGNLKLVRFYSGIKDLEIQAADSCDKQLREIEQLLQEQPVPNEDDPQWQQLAAAWYQQNADNLTALSMPPQPPLTASVPIDEQWDFHEFEVAKCKQWLSSEMRYEQSRKGNEAGIQNVRLHAGLHQAELDKRAAQAASQQQQQRMSISAKLADLPSTVQDQVIQADGYQPAPQDTQVASIQSAQQKAADVQNTAATARHKAVLAAREETARELPATPKGDGL